MSNSMSMIGWCKIFFKKLSFFKVLKKFRMRNLALITIKKNRFYLKLDQSDSKLQFFVNRKNRNFQEALSQCCFQQAISPSNTACRHQNRKSSASTWAPRFLRQVAISLVSNVFLLVIPKKVHFQQLSLELNHFQAFITQLRVERR